MTIDAVPGERAWRWAAAALLVAGTALRLWHYLAAPSLWMDEQMLALAIAVRPGLGVLSPLDFDQSGPPLFLLAERAITALGGMSERMLRLLPIAASIALLPALAAAGRRLVGGAASLLPLALIAVFPLALRHANQAKPYALDALMSVVVVVVALGLLEHPDDRRRWTGLGLVGFGALLLSTPAVFVLSGVGLALLTSREIRSDPASRRRWLAWCAAWAIGFAVLYAGFYAPTNSAYLRRFWTGSFLEPSLPAILLALRSWGLNVVLGDELYAPRGAGALLGLCALGGAWWLGRRNGAPGALMLALPILAATAAAIAGAYPFNVRLLLFAAPLFLLLVAGGVAFLVGALPWARARDAFAAAVLLAILVVSAPAALQPPAPMLGEDAQHVLAFPAGSPSTAAPVYVAAAAMPAWIYYTTDWSHPDRERLSRLTRLADALGPNSGNIPSRGRPVVNEGEILRLTDGDRMLLIGVPSGQERSSTIRLPGPDPGWADNEAGRIARAAAPCAWVFLSHQTDEEVRELLDALVRAGLAPRPRATAASSRLVQACHR